MTDKKQGNVRKKIYVLVGILIITIIVILGYMKYFKIQTQLVENNPEIISIIKYNPENFQYYYHSAYSGNTPIAYISGNSLYIEKNVSIVSEDNIRILSTGKKEINISEETYNKLQKDVYKHIISQNCVDIIYEY